MSHHSLVQPAQVTHIINVADDVPNFHESLDQLTYLSLEVGDFGTDRGISRVFAPALVFAVSCREKRAGGILVHCANGSNRSATVATALVTELCGCTLAEAFRHVKQRRPEATPLQDNRREL